MIGKINTHGFIQTKTCSAHWRFWLARSRPACATRLTCARHHLDGNPWGAAVGGYPALTNNM